MSALEMSPFHGIALYKSTLTYLLTSGLRLCFVPDPTDPPGKPAVVDSAKNFIKIQWEKPKKDGGAPVTGYNIERKDPRTGTWNKINDEPVKVPHRHHHRHQSINQSIILFYSAPKS